MDSSRLADVDAVLAEANGREATRWTLVGKLAGGYQQGAYELVGSDGSRAVLKWHTGHLPAKQLTQTAVAIESARARGWPTPRWITYGALPSDGAYIVEEYVEGERPRRFDAPTFQRLLDAIRTQADARPITDQDWSAYIHRVVFEGEADLATRMRARPDTAALLRRLERITADGRDQRLPATDLVHGDFVPNNMVVRESLPWLVDCAHAGKGTRAYDLATLLMETAVGGDYEPLPPAHQRTIERQCIAIVGRTGFLVCVACRMMHLLVFGGMHWDEALPGAVARCGAFLDGLSPED